MNYQISKVLYNLYDEKVKNINYSLQQLLDSLDRGTSSEALSKISSKNSEETVNIMIDEVNLKKINLFWKKEINNEIIEILLWIAVMFPEV